MPRAAGQSGPLGPMRQVWPDHKGGLIVRFGGSQWRAPADTKFRDGDTVRCLFTGSTTIQVTRLNFHHTEYWALVDPVV
jgi:hypothetical protein